MQVLEPITIADTRAFLSLNLHDAEEDALLEMLISGARAQAETYLRRHIAQQEVILQMSAKPDIYLNDTILFVNSVTLSGTDITTQCTIESPNVIHTPASRDRTIKITYVCDEFCPPEVKNALLMMVRNSYTDRGSNPMSEDIKAILAPHRVIRV